MLKRLYVDNFRALVNTDLALERRTLLMGANGTGKSTFADVLLRLQWLLSGVSKTDEIFTSDTLTRLYGTPIEVLTTSDGRLVVVGQPEAPSHHSDRHGP